MKYALVGLLLVAGCTPAYRSDCSFIGDQTQDVALDMIRQSRQQGVSRDVLEQAGFERLAPRELECWLSLIEQVY